MIDDRFPRQFGKRPPRGPGTFRPPWWYNVGMEKERFSRQDLLRIAADAGFENVTSEQLKGWYEHGLLRPPKQSHEPGRSGSVSWYPGGSDTQVLAICNRHFTLGEKRLDFVGFWLWWDGCYVDWKKLRGMLRRILVKATGDIARASKEAGGDFELAEVAAARITAADVSLMPGLKSRIGDAADYQTVIFSLIQLALGEEPAWGTGGGDDLEPERDIEELLSVGMGSPPEDTSYQQIVGQGVSSPIFPVTSLPSVLAKASKRRLAIARASARYVCEDIPQAIRAAEASGQISPDLAGYGVLDLFEHPRLRVILRVMAAASLLAMKVSISNGPIAPEWSGCSPALPDDS